MTFHVLVKSRCLLIRTLSSVIFYFIFIFEKLKQSKADVSQLFLRRRTCVDVICAKNVTPYRLLVYTNILEELYDLAFCDGVRSNSEERTWTEVEKTLIAYCI